ncbi:unnamed protein product [Lactuca virosa]|uniref:Sin1 middle CRIM domain-containing protein n=1 Tax=Lactuca virosa TaxID=75947 RepID=A0AAU9P9W9_9ASTR|nr:unnamed protein product [Lactuca virosa]
MFEEGSSSKVEEGTSTIDIEINFGEDVSDSQFWDNEEIQQALQRDIEIQTENVKKDMSNTKCDYFDNDEDFWNNPELYKMADYSIEAFKSKKKFQNSPVLYSDIENTESKDRFMEESLSKNHIVLQEISRMPSFSLVVSQEDISDEQLNVKSEIKETISFKLPVVAKLKIEEMENRINHSLRSPYRLIEVETHKQLTCDENIVCDWLFSCKGEPIDEVIKTKRGDTTIRVAMKSLLPSFEITVAVLDCWSDHLNYDDNARHANSPSRVFCKVTTTVFFHVIRKESTFLVVFNLNSTVYEIIDNVSGTIHEVVYDDLAENLDIQRSSATKCSSESMKLHITDLPWKTVKKTNDKGIFAMRHMETYKGKLLRKWNTGLLEEGPKQKTVLNKLRYKYAAKMLLSDLNIHRDKIIHLANEYQKNIRY